MAYEGGGALGGALFKSIDGALEVAHPNRHVRESFQLDSVSDSNGAGQRRVGDTHNVIATLGGTLVALLRMLVTAEERLEERAKELRVVGRQGGVGGGRQRDGARSGRRCQVINGVGWDGHEGRVKRVEAGRERGEGSRRKRRRWRAGGLCKWKEEVGDGGGGEALFIGEDSAGERRTSNVLLDMGWGLLLGPGNWDGVCPTGEGVAYLE